jgi:hypothetical protein
MWSKVGRKKLGEMSVIIYSKNLRGMNHDKEEELIITLVQPLFFKSSMSWTMIATITIGYFVGLATSLGCL